MAASIVFMPYSERGLPAAFAAPQIGVIFFARQKKLGRAV
jgi:hypothetical protein